MRRQDPWAVQLRLDGDCETVPNEPGRPRPQQLALDEIAGGLAVEKPEDTQADTARMYDVARDVAAATGDSERYLDEQKVN